MDSVKIIDVEDVADAPTPEEHLPALTKDFLLAGRAHFIVTNPKGDWMSFVIVAREGKRGTKWHGTTSYYVRAFDKDERRYRYVGVVDENGDIISTGRSEYVKGTPQYDIASWAIKCAWNQTPILDGYAITHNGKCGKCSRVLVERGDRETGFHLDCTPTSVAEAEL